MKTQRIVSAMIMMLAIVVLALIFLTTKAGDEIQVIEVCKQTCIGELQKGANLTRGPCLLNPVPNYPDWVCDVSHSPRLATDILCENMCPAYKEYRAICQNDTSYLGKPADHFVEVDPNCTFIRAV